MSIQTQPSQHPASAFIDSAKSDEYFAGNQTLYFEILEKFADQYQHFRFSASDAEQLSNELHDLKSLSAVIGATALHEVIIEAESSKNAALVPLCDARLRSTVNEVKTLLKSAPSLISG